MISCSKEYGVHLLFSVCDRPIFRVHLGHGVDTLGQDYRGFQWSFSGFFKGERVHKKEKQVARGVMRKGSLGQSLMVGRIVVVWDHLSYFLFIYKAEKLQLLQDMVVQYVYNTSCEELVHMVSTELSGN
ncbi:hypothetical protein YC2023_104693 [Brassica napus]